jgi:succinate dehydrogenase / fumarate reductase cytochrome b subunit
MALTGLSLVIFTILHLAGNLLLFKKDPQAFNGYAEKLESFGLLFTLAEVGLLAVIVVHIAMAIGLKRGAAAARPHGYTETKSKGGPSRSNISSKNMIITGILLLAFLILHLWQFRFEGAASSKEMEENLYAMVYATFKNPIYVFIYEAAMIMLGLHLRHGFWSAFQSLGAINAKLDKPLQVLGWIIAGILTIGFLGIPLWLFFDTAGGAM